MDRGPHGFEVVAYLLAQKLLMPSKFLLIRGNHEIRAVQEAFTFKQECLDKFGSELGLEVWDAVNSAFDAMPIAAVIDKKVNLKVLGNFQWRNLHNEVTSFLRKAPFNVSYSEDISVQGSKSIRHGIY